MSVDVWTIATIVLGAATVFAGAWVAIAQKKVGLALELLAKAVKLGKDTLEASADKVYTPEEKALIKQDWLDLEAVAKKLGTKEVKEVKEA
jgi:hypothetical protein